MKRFSILEVSCEACGRSQVPDGWPGRCARCMASTFRVEIERTASGWESFDLEDFIPKPGVAALLADPGSSGQFWRTQSFLECSGISGDEIIGFCSATLEERRRKYVVWKRRELEVGLTADRRVCGRCGVIFKVYGNKWNQGGFCSRSCRHAASKSNRLGR